MFVAFAPESVAAKEELARVIQGAADALHAATPVDPGRAPRYPGEGTLRVRAESGRLGVPVNRRQWDAVLRLAE